MRILMVTEDLPGAPVGGLGKHVVTLSNAMLELGHEVAILGRADRAPFGSAAAIGFDGRLIPGFAFARPGWKEAQLGFFNPLKRPWFARRIARMVRRHAAGSVAPGQVQAGAVLLAGRLDAGKGVGEFLAQLDGWLAPPAQVTVIGDGPLRAALEARHAGERVRFLGWRPYDEVIGTAARSHLCVVLSLLEEPCATTVVEALAPGKPYLALARGGTPELGAYQYYDGQLRLADDMPLLLAILVEQLARAPRTVPLPASFALDVFQAIPGILDVYAE
jgi:hypothetical protein